MLLRINMKSGNQGGEIAVKSSMVAEAICGIAVFLGLAAMSASAARANDDHRACATAKKYMALLEHRDFDGVAKLFAMNAVFYTPVGAVIHGSEAISDFYKTVIASANLIGRGQNYVGDKSDC